MIDDQPQQPFVVNVDGYVVSDDPNAVDLDLVHGFLSTEAYWSRGIGRELVERAISHSLCFGAYRDGRQLGFARVVTDRATFAYLCDVFVIEAERGRGLGRQLCSAILRHPDLQGLRRFLLATVDAQGLYEQLGFQLIQRPERFMEIYTPATELYQ